MVDAGKTRVAVVFGGRSSEHAISCVSAFGVMHALESSGFEVVPIGITPQGRWVIADDRSELQIADRALPEIKDGADVVLAGDPTVAGLIPLTTQPGQHLAEYDVVFPVLHGAYGEDGTIQGLLELAGVPYVGAGVLASAVGMDKEFTKRLLIGAGLPVGPYAVLRPGVDMARADIERLGFPMFVKPARAGSSLGVSKVTTADELAEAIDRAREIDPKVIVESAIVGREVECGVLQAEQPGAAPNVSLPVEIRVVTGHDWYDFEAKYLDDACEFDIPAQLPAEVITRVQRLAAETFTALGVTGLSRVDFFVTEQDGDYQVFVNEINTMPGFTPSSVFPRIWAASGVSYPELVTRLVHTALRNGTGLR